VHFNKTIAFSAIKSKLENKIAKERLQIDQSAEDPQQ
jgi:hypothetical protein